MTPKKHIYLRYFFILFFCSCIYGQTKKLSVIPNPSQFDELRALILSEPQTAVRIQIVQKVLRASKKKLDTIGIANAYYFLAKLDIQQQLRYADSLINITKNVGTDNYPAKGYLIKANSNYEIGNYKEALDNYLKASNAAKKYKNEPLYQSIRFNIGLLRNNAGERAEAQAAFADYLSFLEKQPAPRNSSAYINTLFALADSYVHTEKIDLAPEVIAKGINETLRVKDTITYAYFIITSGIHQFQVKNYNRAIDSLTKGKLLLQKLDTETTRLAISDYYTARCHKALDNTERAIRYFKSVDSTLKKTEDVIPELMDSYQYLIADAEEKKEYQSQIEYINTLLRLDSIYDDNQYYLNKNINKNYDTAELISEKEKLILELKEETFLKQETIFAMTFFLCVLIFIVVYSFRKRHKDKQRFLKLLDTQNKKNQQPVKFKISEEEYAKKNEIDIPEEVIESILKKLYTFEKSNRFSMDHYTLNSLAKELHTNSAYLSKIINTYKNVNFANYLNNLRIDYTIEQLTKDKSLRSYTIEAIAKEVGFKNGQSFSSAFHKKTGLHPSYFIKQMETGKSVKN